MSTFFTKINNMNNLFFNGSLDDFVQVLQDFEWVELFTVDYNEKLGKVEKKNLYIATCTIDSYEVPDDYTLPCIAYVITQNIGYSSKYDDILAALQKWVVIESDEQIAANTTCKKDCSCEEECNIEKNIHTLDEIIGEIMDDPEIITLMNRLKDIYASDYAKRR